MIEPTKLCTFYCTVPVTEKNQNRHSSQCCDMTAEARRLAAQGSLPPVFQLFWDFALENPKSSLHQQRVLEVLRLYQPDLFASPA